MLLWAYQRRTILTNLIPLITIPYRFTLHACRRPKLYICLQFRSVVIPASKLNRRHSQRRKITPLPPIAAKAARMASWLKNRSLLPITAYHSTCKTSSLTFVELATANTIASVIRPVAQASPSGRPGPPAPSQAHRLRPNHRRRYPGQTSTRRKCSARRRWGTSSSTARARGSRHARISLRRIYPQASDRKSTRLNSSHYGESRMPSSA